VLPEQPEPSTGPKSPRVARDLTMSQSRTETSDSEEEEEEGDDEAEDEPEADAEVCIIPSDDRNIDVISRRSTTNWTSYLLAQPVGMLAG